MAIDIQALGELQVLDEEGAPQPLASLWSETTAILVFLRHFG